MTFDPATVVTSALVATCVGALLTAWRDVRNEKRITRVDALRAAVAIEGYAIECAHTIADHENAESSDDYVGKRIRAVPALPDFTLTVGLLQPRKAAIAHRLAVFPQEIKQAEQSAAFWWDVTADMEIARTATVHGTARVGLEGLAIADELRAAFKLPSRCLVFGPFDVRKCLVSALPRDAS